MNESVDSQGMEWACRQLTAPADTLSPAEMAIAVDAVVDMAEEVAEDRSFVLFHRPNADVEITPKDYLKSVVLPAHEAGLISDEWLERWEEAVETGNARRDPRVKRFCAEGNSWLDDLYGPFLKQRQVLADHLGVEPASVRLLSAEWGPVIMECEGDVYKVFGPGEAKETAIRSVRRSTLSLAKQAKSEDAKPEWLRVFDPSDEPGQWPSTRDFLRRILEGDQETLDLMVDHRKNLVPMLAYGECGDGFVRRLDDGTLILRMMDLEPWLENLANGD